MRNRVASNPTPTQARRLRSIYPFPPRCELGFRPDGPTPHEAVPASPTPELNRESPLRILSYRHLPDKHIKQRIIYFHCTTARDVVNARGHAARGRSLIGAQGLTVPSGSPSLESINTVGRDQTPCKAHADAREVAARSHHEAGCDYQQQSRQQPDPERCAQTSAHSSLTPNQCATGHRPDTPPCGRKLLPLIIPHQGIQKVNRRYTFG